MSGLFARLRQNIRKNSFEKKVSWFLVAAILVTALSLLAATTVSAVNSLVQKSHSLAAQQIDSLSRNMEASLSDYRDQIILLLMDDRIQAYLKASPGESDPAAVNAAYQALFYMRSAKPSIDYIMVAREDRDDTFLYGGSSLASFPRGSGQILSDYAESQATSFGSLRYRMTELTNGRRILQFYHPVFDKYRLNKRLGILCIGIGEEALSQFCSGGEDLTLHTRITDLAGTVLYDLDQDNIGRRERFAGQIAARSGSFTANGDIVVYRTIGRWDLRLIGSISMRELLADSYKTAAAALILTAVLTLLSLTICTRLIYRLCAPLREAVTKMQVVSSGNLQVRMNEEHIGDDFREIAENFNGMVIKLQNLMERVKLEERRNEQVRFNILQSQIQPHFLYNTLECIHWQAAANGDREASEMVKALASYYRLCLSHGRDVIPLRQEIALVNSYLTIQNMRYDNIIEGVFELDDEMLEIMLPKMTLQPLVENAIYHGVKDRGGKYGVVRLTARVEDTDAVLVFSDDGAGMSVEKLRELNDSLARPDDSGSYGVRNVNKRIQILFGEGYGLHYSSNGSGGITVEIRLPYRAPAV